MKDSRQIKVDNRPLKALRIREAEKVLVLLANQIVIIGPEWWAMKKAHSYESPITEVLPTTVRVNRIETGLSKLLENIEHETQK